MFRRFKRAKYILSETRNKINGYNSNIKYIDSTIKCVIFEPIHCVSNLDVVSSPFFNNFDFMFL